MWPLSFSISVSPCFLVMIGGLGFLSHSSVKALKRQGSLFSDFKIETNQLRCVVVFLFLFVLVLVFFFATC